MKLWMLCSLVTLAVACNGTATTSDPQATAVTDPTVQDPPAGGAGTSTGSTSTGSTSTGSTSTGSTSTGSTSTGSTSTGSTSTGSTSTGSTSTGSTSTGSTSTGSTSTGSTSTGSTSTGSTSTGTPTTPPVPVYSYEWYVAPSGNDTAEGTQARPFRTINKALSVVAAGERINVMAGTYAERVMITDQVASGTQAKPIALQGHGTPLILVGSTSWSMVEIQKPYWTVDGFKIDAGGGKHAGVSFTSANTTGSTLSHCEVFHGTAGAAVAVTSDATGVVIDSNHIHDYWVTGVDAHGVLVEWTTRNTRVTNNSIHDVSGDSVQCEGPETYSDTAAPADGLLIEGNDLFHNGEQAVDIKTCHNVVIRNNDIHDFDVSSVPGGCSMVIHMSALNVTVEDNTFTNVGNAIALGGNHLGPVPTNITIQKNRFVGLHIASTMDGSGVRIENSNGTRLRNNTFTAGQGPALIVGMGDQGSTTDLTVENNLVDVSYAVKLGGYGVSLSFDHNLYRGFSTFTGPGVSGGLSAWQKLGYDKDAVLADPQLSSDGLLTPGAAAVDKGLNVGLPFCGTAPELGAAEVCQ